MKGHHTYIDKATINVEDKVGDFFSRLIVFKQTNLIGKCGQFITTNPPRSPQMVFFFLFGNPQKIPLNQVKDL